MTQHSSPDYELIAFLKGIDTPTVANAIEVLDVCSRATGFPSLELRCLFPELGVMCGYAVTAHVETVTDANPKTEEAFVELFEAVERSEKPAVVVVQEIGGDRDRAAHCGEVMSTIFGALGGIGLVSDCAVRDLSAVRKLGFHYFARGAVSSHANFRIVRCNVPCEVLGMTVHPGDLLHGDENGIVNIPTSRRAGLRDAIQQIVSAERAIFDSARKTGFTAASLRNRFSTRFLHGAARSADYLHTSRSVSSMKRREFLKTASLGLATTPWLRSDSLSGEIDLAKCVVVAPQNATDRENKAVAVLVEEVQKRSQIRWEVQHGSSSHTETTIIYAATRSSSAGMGDLISEASSAAAHEGRDGYAIRTGNNTAGRWIAVVGVDERGLLFGVGRLLRLMRIRRGSIKLDARHLTISTSPKCALRGHQLGYRPKTNAYDAWTVSEWDQYIRDLAVFGTNAIELLPPRTDDEPDSPHFPLPPEKMMVEMSRIADSYGLDVWIWYPAMDPDYADPAAVDAALKEWAHIYQIVPRIDAVFVPGGDPGHTEPKAMLAFLEKQKASLRRFHPRAQMWVSPQGFRKEWLQDFFAITDEAHTATWLDGIVFGPQNRMSLPEIRQRLSKRYPIRFYPDITHSVECQYPVPDWDVAFALTEGREVINPRPMGEANILRRNSPYTIGFLTYSEGCNDDVNKFVWSSLGWAPEMPVIDALREFGNYFMGAAYAEGVAQGLLHLEENWNGPLATNNGVAVTIARFKDIEQSATPALLQNWRFQQALYRAYYDAALRTRLLHETECVERARGVLERVTEIGWSPEPLNIGEEPSTSPPNGRDPSILLEQAEQILAAALTRSAGEPFTQRVRELGEALFQSIQMQLSVERYQAEAVNRAANLDTLEAPVTDLPWLRKQIATIRKLETSNQQIAAIKKILTRTDPGPGGFYDELGNLTNRPHLILGPGFREDPEFRISALTGFSYPDRLGDTAPIAWKRWAESLFDAPLKMQYGELDPSAQYRIRIVYSGDARRVRIRLLANNKHEIHPLMLRPWPPQALEFDIPPEATAKGELHLAWTREQGLGGNGRGCQVSEVWLLQK